MILRVFYEETRNLKTFLDTWRGLPGTPSRLRGVMYIRTTKENAMTDMKKALGNKKPLGEIRGYEDNQITNLILELNQNMMRGGQRLSTIRVNPIYINELDLNVMKKNRIVVIPDLTPSVFSFMPKPVSYRHKFSEGLYGVLDRLLHEGLYVPASV